MSKDILTPYERALTEYWYNWKPGMPVFGKTKEDYPEPERKVEVKVEVRNEEPDFTLWDIL